MLPQVVNNKARNLAARQKRAEVWQRVVAEFNAATGKGYSRKKLEALFKRELKKMAN